MSLPPAEQLSRWTVGQVTDWLTESSLTVFRQEFLIDNIDGNKLLRMSPQEIDQKYKHIPKRKRDVLKTHVSRIDSSRPPPSWTPQLPPRPPAGDRARIPAPPPEDDNDDDDGWGTDFDDDIDDYLEPTSRPPPAPGHSLNGQHRPAYDHGELPQSEYEIDPCADDFDVLGMKPHSELGRSETMIDRLRNQLAQRTIASEEPPPRPPRGRPETAAARPDLTKIRSDSPQRSPAPAHRRPLPPPETRNYNAAPEDEYEIMNDLEEKPDEGGCYMVPETVMSPQNSYLDFSETCKKAHGTQQHRRDPPMPAEPSPPPRPVRRAGPETSTPAGEDLSVYPWYHGKIDRVHATRIFEREQKNGMFLIRKSERDPKQPYTLVIWDSNRIWNLPVRKLDNNLYAPGKFKQGETQFKSIVELIEHFKVTPLNLRSGGNYAEGSNVLTIPAPKR